MSYGLAGLKCGDVLISAPITETFLSSMEDLHKKRTPYKEFAPHSFAIFLTKQKVKFSLVFSQTYYLLWKPFFGVRWLPEEDVPPIYMKIKKNIDGEKLNFDLGLQELEVKQDHFNKWRGEEITDKLIAYVLREDTTKRFQALMEEVAVKVENETYKPESSLTPKPKKLQI